MITSKSPNAVARIAYATAKCSLPAYHHIKSPKKFTQHQLVACLVLKEFFKKDYRGIKDTLDKLIKGILTLAMKGKIMKKNVHLSAIDGTGLESHHISRYFVKRKDKSASYYQMTTYTRYPKVGIIADCATHLILSGVPERGPYPDHSHFEKAVMEAKKNVSLNVLTADAGYDSEHAHIFAREQHNIRTIIPPLAGRKTHKLPSTKYRRLMATRFNKKLYGQRWQVETVNSMIKRNLGSFLRARSYWSQCREIMLRLLTHNIMIVWRP